MKEKLLEMLMCEEIYDWEKMKTTPIYKVDKWELERVMLKALGKYEDIVQYVIEKTDDLSSNQS